ncbi:MAG: hypothetical protein ACYCTY_09605 [Sulfuricella sp.]
MNHDPLISHHHKLVAKIGLSVGVLSCAVLLITLKFITNDVGESYSADILSKTLTREQLGPAMLVAGLVLATISGLMTWIITLYSTFRVAGPLYRFTRNLKLATENASPVELVAIRKDDTMHEQAKAIKQAIFGLSDHYAAMKDATREASSALAAGDAAQYADAVAHLRRLDEKIHI